MTVRLRTFHTLKGLSEAQVEFLLLTDSTTDPFLEFDDIDWRALWRQHAAALRGEAQRRGITRPWGQLQFDKETD